MSTSESVSADTSLKTTPLNTLHIELGAKMVPFAGYSMPVQYPLGVLKEHLHTRAKAGLFDVSHMGQVVVTGKQVASCMEQLIPIEIEALPINSQRYGVLPNEQGGLLDDLIVTRWAEDTLFIVINAGCKEQDLAHFKAACPQLDFNLLQDQALLALQGPAAVTVMAALAPAVCELTFMHGIRVSIDGADCYVTRSGYTGEDGFEISVPADAVEVLARRLLSFEQVEAVGLGARDSLRLEAGLCLYGHDMNEQTSPIEASLLWSISKSRREGAAKAGGFTGSEKILQHIREGAQQKRVGLKVTGRAPVREGAELVDENGKVVGKVTSGGFGPSFNAPLAMGYVNKPMYELGSKLFALVRKKQIPVEVVKTPFVTQRYFRG